MYLSRSRARRSLTLIVAVLLPALALVAGVQPPASAAAPGNNGIRAAVAVGPLPFTFTESTRGATWRRSDGRCVDGSSVWFRYRAHSTAAERVVTAGSTYDTVLAVFAGTRAHRTLVACNDDSDYSADGASAVRVRFVADHTYWIAVSACCSRRASGAQLTLNVYPPRPAGITTTITSVESGTVSGRLWVSGTTTCDTPSFAYVELFASQRVDSEVASGYGEEDLSYCTGAPSTWKVALDSETGVAFAPGQLALTSQGEVSDGFTDLVTDEQTQNLTVVPLATGRGAK